MGLANKLKDLAVELERKNNSLFEYPVDKQKKYVAHFHEPKDDIERGYFQYRCQMKFNNPVITCLLNLASLPMMLLYLKKGNSSITAGKHTDAIFFSDGKPENIIPDELREKVGSLEVIDEKKEYLTKQDKTFIKSLWKRYPFSWQFLLKCLMKVRFYSYEIERTHPSSIIVCNEYSFTSSVLTKYCGEQGIQHINVMHGEKLYFMRDSFFRFHECYVWDEHYKDIFERLRADKKQFKVAIPESLRIKTEGADKTVDYTYYLGAEKDDILKTIVNAMSELQKKGYRVAIRPHPRYSDIQEIKTTAPSVEIEEIKEFTIEDSLKRTGHAVSVYSTVLNQASCNDIGIVLDDVSNPSKFARLKEIDFIMLSKPHELLSELLEKKR
jgi:hypothetical protein